VDQVTSCYTLYSLRGRPSAQCISGGLSGPRRPLGLLVKLVVMPAGRGAFSKTNVRVMEPAGHGAFGESWLTNSEPASLVAFGMWDVRMQSN
jgi:hypothetical protein